MPAPFTKPESQPSQPSPSNLQRQQARQPEQDASPSQKISRVPKSTALKDLIAHEQETVYQPVGQETSTLSTPFGEDDLIRCWDAYSETLEEKAHLKNTMINCKPVLLDQFKFEVKVHNPAQQEELISHSIDLLKLLRTQLKNSFIQMHIRIDETNEKKRAYTSEEKLAFLADLNPLLSKFKDEFDLVIN